MDNQEFISLAREFGKRNGIDCSVAFTKPVEEKLFCLYVSHPNGLNSTITSPCGYDFYWYTPEKREELDSAVKSYRAWGHHVYFQEYRASSEGGVSSDFLTAPPNEVIKTFFHEGWHRELKDKDCRMGYRAVIEEPCCDVVGFTAAEEFFFELGYRDIAVQVQADRQIRRKEADAFLERYFRRLHLLKHGGFVNPDDADNNAVLLARRRYYLHFPLVDDGAVKMEKFDSVISLLKGLPRSRKAAVVALENVVGTRFKEVGRYERLPAL